MSEGTLTVTVDRRENADIVSLSGVLDLYTAPRLRDALFGAGRDALHLVLDLSGLTFLDSIGIVTIVAGRRLCAARGGMTVVVAVAGTSAHRILHIVALNLVMEIVPDVETARESLAATATGERHDRHDRSR